MVSIKSVGKVYTGKTPSKLVPEYFGGDIPFITPTELNKDVYVNSAPQTITELGAAQITVIPENSIMVCCIGSLGKIGIAQRPLATNQQINSIVFDENKVFPKYGYYACSRLKPILESLAPATTIAIINKSRFEALEIPLPPLPEQIRIAAILDKADSLRRKNQQAIQLADQFLRAVFLDMFGDPVTNPKDWEVNELNQVCTDIVDCVNKTAKTVDYKTPYKMIRTTNVRNYSINVEDVRYVEKDIYEKWISRLKPKIGDIVFTREAPSGESGIIETNDAVFLGQRTMQFRPNDKQMDSVFLLYELMDNGIKQQIKKLSAGSTVTHLSVPECKKFKIRVPPIELQRKFAKIRSKVLHFSKNEKLSRQSSDDFFNSLSQKAFAGEL